MIYNYKHGKVELDDTNINYISFGTGERKLIIIQGLNMRDIGNEGIFLATMFKQFTKDFTVFMFDRRMNVTEGFDVWDITNDIYRAMEKLSIKKADFVGVSQGGMISMAMALEHPQVVNKLIVGVSAARTNSTIEASVGKWVEHAKNKNYIDINRETIELMYTEKTRKKYKLFMPLLVRASKPKDFKRFEILASAARDFDCYDRLEEIKCPTLVIGGKQDKVTSGAASEEIAEKMKCELYMYEDYGHAVYEEANDFYDRVVNFLKS